MFEDADLIRRYTRADAIRDGVLIDVSELARGAGIRHPVALTRAVWQRCVTVPPGVACQDEAGTGVSGQDDFDAGGRRINTLIAHYPNCFANRSPPPLQLFPSNPAI
jgi:hypothetical protein